MTPPFAPRPSLSELRALEADVLAELEALRARIEAWERLVSMQPAPLHRSVFLLFAAPSPLSPGRRWSVTSRRTPPAPPGALDERHLPDGLVLRRVQADGEERLEPGAARIVADVAVLRRLRDEGRLLGVRTLEGLVEIRRARDLARGPGRLAEAIRRLEGMVTPPPSSTARTSA